MADQNNIGLAKQARQIAERMRWDAEGMNRISTASGPEVFIPFPQWYDAIADALEEK